MPRPTKLNAARSAQIIEKIELGNYEGTTLRTVYFAILITHTILAAAVPVLAIITLRRGLAARYDKHRRIARWTLPIWLYVSVTGVVVYIMLYHLA
jgi:uncharacterized membrane protein YozB (DUF420 family)